MLNGTIYTEKLREGVYLLSEYYRGKMLTVGYLFKRGSGYVLQSKGDLYEELDMTEYRTLKAAKLAVQEVQ